MKKEMMIVFSSLVLLTGCGGNQGISLEGNWVKKQEYLEGNPQNNDRCLSKYDNVTFDSKTVIMEDFEYSYEVENQEDVIQLKLVDETINEVKYYTVKKLKNGNILMQEKDSDLGCELEKK
ncbi:hypothetical protein [Bacillus taeanensis]|uniref:Lipoprotein n=1 Tax=Bacillus taeanensis TaxID=273032 RepID=A0A366XSV8_9BACI|nr:hypothetical protein [Bacillus taeanensis]RBW68235.1 hypothetical protein DS031_17825 [Bacillus taeanensis]